MRRVHAYSLALPFHEPYSFALLLSFLAARAIACVEHVTSERYTRSFLLDGAPGVLSVEQVAPNQLRATVHTTSDHVLPHIERKLRALFDLDSDPHAIALQLARDAALAPLLTARPGLRVPGAWDGLELCVRAILGQQITVSAATQLCSQLVHAHGTPLAPELVTPFVTHTFPSAQTLANADLSMLKMPGARRNSIALLARAVLGTPRVLQPQDTLEQTITTLCTLRGIGPWTAHYIALRWHREADAFPVGDVALIRALGVLLERDVSARELSVYAERWRPYRAYAVLHLWSSLADAAPRVRTKRAPLKRRLGAT